MNFIKFDTIDSTNDFLKNWVIDNSLQNFFYVYADFQTKGKGQRANVWEAEQGKNLLISFYLKPNFSPKKQFLISQIVSISIVELLETFNISGVAIKYPNDILAERKKISGVLIENIIQRKTIKHSIIGIGLNVNQTSFCNLPNATSIKKIINQDVDIELLIVKLSSLIKNNYQRDEKYISKQYLKYLFYKGKKNTFMTDKKTYNGELIGFDPNTERIVILNNDEKIEIPVRTIEKAEFI